MAREDWEVRICAAGRTDLGEVENRLLILTTDTSIGGAFGIEGRFDSVSIKNGKIKQQLGASHPRLVTFEVNKDLFKGRIIRFSDKSGVMFGHVKGRKPRKPPFEDDDDGEVWVATKGGGGEIIDLKSQPDTTTTRKKPKTARKKKKAK